MRKVVLLVLLLWILFLVSLAAWEPGYGQNTTPPQSPERFAKVRTMILEALQKIGAPSISIAVAENGKVVWEESFGYADKEKKIQATPDSIYALASISKSFTGTGLMVLAERKLVDLDRPVNDYLGEAKLTVHAGDARRVTLRRMLHMEAGMPMHWNIFEASEAARRTPQDESIRRYGIVVNEQGREYVYSNFAYGVLDRVISRVSGKEYSRFMREEVFEPLGLSRTAVYFTPELAPHVVQNYDAAGKLLPPLAYDHDGASAVHASVRDLVRFGLFHLKNRVPGQIPILSPGSLDLLHEPSPLNVSEAGTIGHMAMGWGILNLAGRHFVIASGSAPGTMSRLTLIPEKNLAVALLCNASLPDELALWKIEWETFAAMIPDFPEIPAIPEDKPPAFIPPRELVGEWRGAVQTYQGHVPMTLMVNGGQEITIELDGRTGGPIPITTALGPLSFRDGWLSGLFFGSIPTEDAKRSPHVVFLRLQLQGDILSGTVSAVAVDKSFALPYWVSLKLKLEP